MLLPLLLNNLMGEGGDPPDPPGEAFEHAFTPETGFQHRHGGFLMKSFTPSQGAFFGWQKPYNIRGAVTRASRISRFKGVDVWRWPVDRAWFERMEGKLDECIKDGKETHERVCKLETKLEERTKLSNWVLRGLAALVIALAGYLVGGCHAPKDVAQPVDAVVVAQPADVGMASRVGILVNCTSVDGMSFQSGSGAVVDSRHVMTAHHVITCDGGNPMMIIATAEDGTTSEMVVETAGKDDSQDYAVLVTTGTWEPFKRDADLSDLPVKVGDMVCAYSVNPLPTKVCGYVSKLRGSTDAHSDGWAGLGFFDFIPIDDPLTPEKERNVHGNSGAGVYNMANELVGLLSGGPLDGSFTIVYGLTGVEVPPPSVDLGF